MMAREVTYIKQDKPEGENLPAFLRYNKSLGQKTNGKFVLDNGLKMCWGVANNGSITFPITFTSVPFVIGSFSNGNSDVFFASHMTSRSVSGATYTGHYSTDGQTWVSYLNGLTWFAIGY